MTKNTGASAKVCFLIFLELRTRGCQDAKAAYESFSGTPSWLTRER